MKATSLTLRKPHSELAGSWLDRLARRIMLRRLELLTRGRLVIEESGVQLCFGDGQGETVRVEVLDPGLYRELVFGGSIGAGEAYMRGDWRCDDLTALVQLLLRNRELLDGLDAGPLYLQGPLNRLKHSLRRNTKRGSRRNIAGALRPGQHPVQPVSGPDHDVFECGLRAAGHGPAPSRPGEAGAHLPQARSGPRRPPVGDRHRLGRHGPLRR